MDHLGWRTSSYSGNGANCVDVAPVAAGVLVRDTKDHGSGPVLPFTPEEWAAFLREVAADAPSANGAVTAVPGESGVVLKTSAGTRLTFTPTEWAAFRAGVRAGEFDQLVR